VWKFICAMVQNCTCSLEFYNTKQWAECKMGMCNNSAAGEAILLTTWLYLSSLQPVQKVLNNCIKMGDHQSSKSLTVRFTCTEMPLNGSSLALFCLYSFLLHEHYEAWTQRFTLPPVFHFKLITILYYFTHQGYHVSHLIRCIISMKSALKNHFVS